MMPVPMPMMAMPGMPAMPGMGMPGMPGMIPSYGVPTWPPMMGMHMMVPVMMPRKLASASAPVKGEPKKTSNKD